jgi:hypothetical protein
MILKLTLFFVFFVSLNPCYARNWKNKEGKVIEAEFVKFDGTNVIIATKGREFTLPISTLSNEDQVFARIQSEEFEVESNSSEELMLGGEKLVRGQQNNVVLSLNEEQKKLADKGKISWKNITKSSKDKNENNKVEKTLLCIGLPDKFDPKKSWPIFVAWDTGDSKNNKQASTIYWEACRKKAGLLFL